MSSGPTTPSGDGRAAAAPDAGPQAADLGISALYGTSWTPMVRLAVLLTGDASVAEEIVQDSFVRLHTRWDHLRDAEAARAYLRMSVVNASRSALRHRGVVERLRGAPPPAGPGPEELALQAARDATVVAALRRLPRRQREVLVLRFFADLTEREVAETLGISLGAVKSHASRGMTALRVHLRGEASGTPSRREGEPDGR